MTDTLPLDDGLIILAAAILFVPLFQYLKDIARFGPGP